MPNILVTGVNGFVGNHLVNTLVDQGYEVSGLVYRNAPNTAISNKLKTCYTCDLTSIDQVSAIDFRPYDSIINLAGLANVAQSFNNPGLYSRVNVLVLENLCKRLLELDLSPRLIAVSTGAVYESKQSMPLTENSKTVTNGSPYAQSKLAMEKIARKYIKLGLTECLVVRPFNHIGPGQGPGFILPDLYKSLATATQTKAPLMVGNLNTKRDYTDVRDVARAYVLLATAPRASLHHALYNVCSGVPRSGQDILSEFQRELPGSKDVKIKFDESRIRPNDPIELIGSFERLHTDTGWLPSIPFAKTIADFVAAQTT